MKNHRYFVLLLFLIATALFFLYFYGTKKNEINHLKVEDQSYQKTAVSTLSQEINYPSPVQQLQQSVTQGLIKSYNPELPLLKGDLAKFADSNITTNYPQPKELQKLQLRLKRLQTLNLL